jgi:hypothetical protein
MSRHKSSETYFSESPREGGNFSDSVVMHEVRATGVVTSEVVLTVTRTHRRAFRRTLLMYISKFSSIDKVYSRMI